MFRHRPREDSTGEVIALGPPLTDRFDARLGKMLDEGRKLAAAARGIRTPTEYRHWSDALRNWRTSTADTLTAGFVLDRLDARRDRRGGGARGGGP